MDEFLEHDCGMSANETEVEEEELEEGTNCPVRALVLYTDAALTAFTDVVNIIKLSIADVNFILHESHIKENLLKIVLAGTRLLDTTEFVESNDLKVDLSSLPSNNAINFYRGVYDADLVVIMTNAGYTQGTGGVTTFGDFYDDVDSAFAIVETGFATSPAHSFAHEIGHLFGARHERKPQDCASDGDNSGLSYSHGKIITKRFLGGISWQKKTVMAVCAGNSTIPRIEYFSNPNIEYGGKVIGNEQTNYNAKTIANAACRVAHYLNTSEYLNKTISFTHID